LEGRRACTDCWEEPLQHELDWLGLAALSPQTTAGHGLPCLPCGGMVLDAWGVELSWICQKCGSGIPHRIQPSQKWACAAAGLAILEGAGRWSPRLPPRALAPRGLPGVGRLGGGGSAAAFARGGGCTSSSALNHGRLGDQGRSVGDALLLVGFTPV
jgi:hypothetical protein